MKKRIISLLIALTVLLSLFGCGTSSTHSNNSNSTTGKSNYSSNSYSDYDSGGYDMPVQGESFSDYVKRVDPDLYNDMRTNWDNLD